MNVLLAVQGAVAQGILWGIMVVGVYLTYRVLDYADLSVDGSFALGGAVSAIWILKGMNPFLTLLVAMLSGMVAGLVTGLLHTKLKIPGILSGILTQISLYSINMRIMGRSNTSLLGEDTVFSRIISLLPDRIQQLSFIKDLVVILAGALFVGALVAALYWFFGTEVGCAIRATGNNENMVRALGANTDWMKIIGLFLSNGLVALSGALIAQQQGFADVGMGIGAIVTGLASVIIGGVIFRFLRGSFALRLVGAVLGSVIYRIIISVVLQLGMPSTDLRLLTAVIVAAALSLPMIKRKIDSSKAR